MKKLVIAAAVSAAFTAPQAFAQADHFAGWSAGISLNGADTRTEAAIRPLSTSGTASDNNFSLQLQYSIAVNELVVLGMGGSVNFGDLKAGKLAAPIDLVTVKSAYSLYLAPGYAFSNTILGYGKFSYLNANAQAANGNSTRFDSGLGYGVGLQAMFNKSWFGQAEYMINQYDDKSSSLETDRLKSNVFSLGVGYKF